MEEKRYRKYIRIPSDDGKRHRITVEAGNERELEIKYREKLIELGRKDYRFAQEITPRNYFDRYMEIYSRPNMRENAYNDKKARMERYFLSRCGDLPMDSITAPMLQKLLNDQKGKSKSFLSKLKNEITSFFDTAESEGLIQRNPCTRLFLPACENKERRALTPEERRAFLKATDQQKHGLIFQMMYYCGLRPGEARALTYNDIDLNRRTISITKSREDRTGEIKKPKTKSGTRTVPIPDELFKRLPNQKGSNYIFLGDESGGMLSDSTYKRAWQTILNLMDVELGAKRYRNKILPGSSVVDRSLTPYYLRHTYCSMLAELGVDIKTAQYLMGHASISVTVDIKNPYEQLKESKQLDYVCKMRQFGEISLLSHFSFCNLLAKIISIIILPSAMLKRVQVEHGELSQKYCKMV